MQTGTLPVIFSLFQWMPICLSFYVFYTFIHLLLGKTTQSAKPWHKTRVFHWICFIIVVLVACLCFSFNCALNLRKGPAADSPTLMAALPIEFATQIVAWMASAENWGWSIFLAVRHPRCVGGHIVSITYLIPKAMLTMNLPGAAASNSLSTPSNDVLVCRSFLTRHIQNPLVYQRPR